MKTIVNYKIIIIPTMVSYVTHYQQESARLPTEGLHMRSRSCVSDALGWGYSTFQAGGQH
jgi:hypothetical protein